jgi:hypothetical protein
VHTQRLALRVQAVSIAIVFIAASVVAVLGNGSGTTGVPVAGGQVLRLVQRAPLALEDAASVEMNLTLELSSEGQSNTGHVHGRFDPETGIGQATIEVPSGDDVTVTQSGSTLYAPIHEDQVLIYGGSHWVALRLAGNRPPVSTTATGQSYLQLLAGANGQVLSYGDEDIDGVDTTHYKVTINVADALRSTPARLRTTTPEELTAFGIDELPLDVWLDEDGQLRRMQLKLSAQGTTVSITIDMTPSDEPIAVSVPASDDLYEVTDGLQFMSIATGTN